MSPLNNVGFNLGYREIDYFNINSSNTIFTNAGMVFSGRRVRSEYAINLGATNVSRDNTDFEDQDDTGFSGSLYHSAKLSSRSTFKTNVSTDLTDTSSAIGNESVVQLSTDVIRNEVINLAYLRKDAQLRSNIWAEYRKLTYETEVVNDRLVRLFGAQLDYPVTQLLSSGVYVRFNRTIQLNNQSYQSKEFTVGGNIKYRLTAKLHSTFDIKYRTKDSEDLDPNNQDYDEFSVFATLVYGYGSVSRSTKVGTF